MKKVKNMILKAIIAINTFIFLASACAIDSEEFLIPVATAFASGAVLCLFGYANGAFAD